MGHIDIVTRASALFETVIMAVVENPSKCSLMSSADRLNLVKESVRHLANVQIQSFCGLTVDLVKSCQANIIIRGLRAVSDFEYEFAMSQMNKRLCPGVETVFMMADLEYQFISSSMLNEVARLGGSIDGLAPDNVVEYFRTHQAKTGQLPKQR
jgi:pantetheine-phosphate adenylyltransferase